MASAGSACLDWPRSCLDEMFAQWKAKDFIMDPNSNGLWLNLGSTIAIQNIIFQSSMLIFRAPFFVLFVLLFSWSLLQRLGQTQTIYLVIPPQQGSICILR